jgi:hypothetical protein
MVRVLVGSLCAAAVLGGCGGGHRPDATPACVAAARIGVQRLVDRIDAGDARGADAVVGHRNFVWFVLGVRAPGCPPPHVPANRVVDLRWQLRGYLRERIAAGERLEIEAIDVQRPQHGVAGLAVELRRRARDVDHGRWARMHAKGAWDCARRRLTGLAGHSIGRG